MSVTAEQRAQAEAKRQRQADMVQTLSSTKSDVWEPNRTTICWRYTDSGQSRRCRRQRTREEHKPHNNQHQHLRNHRHKSWNTACICKRREHAGDESFMLPSYTSEVDLQLGRVMEKAGLAAHTCVWDPCVLVNQDTDAQLRYLLVILNSGSALQIIRQQASGVQAFRDIARRYNPRSQARALAQLQEGQCGKIRHSSLRS